VLSKRMALSALGLKALAYCCTCLVAYLLCQAPGKCMLENEAFCADETKAKIMGIGKKVLHFTCSNLPALVVLPMTAWTTVSRQNPCLHF